MKTRRSGFCLIFLIFIVSGCLNTYYRQGRTYLDQEDYDAAITSFNMALLKNERDIKSTRELGIAHFSKLEFEEAIRFLNQAFEMDSTDGRTLFYLGASHEIRNDMPNAIEIYRRYVDVSRYESIQSSIRARLTRLIHRQIQEEIAALLAQEGALSAEALSDSVVGVLYFANIGEKRDLDPLQKGIAEMLITDLSKVRQLKVVERIRLQKLMEEMGLGMSGLIDEATSPRLGKLLGASRLVRGTFVDLTQSSIRMDAGLIDCRERKPLESIYVAGSVERLFQLEKDLVFEIINQMGISLTQEERDAIEIIPTENLLAFMAYCRGLDYEDKGLYNRAVEEYRSAVELDPQFFPASENLMRSESMSLEQIGIRQLISLYSAVSSGQPLQAQSQTTGETLPGTEGAMNSEGETEEEAADVFVEAEGAVTEGEAGEEAGTGEETVAEEETEPEEISEEGTEEESQGEASSDSQAQSASGTQVTSQSSPVISRMVQTGSILSQGFLPGLDSRKPDQEQSQSSFGNAASIEVRAPLPPQ